MTAFVGTLFVGTDRLGRALTHQENRELSALLREHDFVGASMVSLRFALKLRRSRPAAQDLQGRANLRFLRLGWDPRVVALVKRLCRLVWSEHTNERSESDKTRRAEEIFLREQGIHVGTSTPSAAETAARIAEERRNEELDERQLEALRAAFIAAKDEVNLLWLDYALEEITDLAEMARRATLDVKDFYLAADRRKRHVQRLIAAQTGAKDEEDA
jgi:hypothetical protein